MEAKEMLLFKELIKETVKAVFKEVLAEETKILRKDLREVKLLVGGAIKEMRENKGNVLDEGSSAPSVKKLFNIPSNTSVLKENAPGMYVQRSERSNNVSIPSAGDLQASLPDIDAPIIFDTNSEVYRSMLESINR